MCYCKKYLSFIVTIERASEYVCGYILLGIGSLQPLFVNLSIALNSSELWPRASISWAILPTQNM